MNELRARVISQEKGIYKVSSPAGVRAAAVSGKYRYEAQTPSDYPAVGDYVTVLWPDDVSSAVITALFPRKSCFMRKAAGTGNREQVVAANIDTVFICMSLNNNFNIRRLERYLSVTYDSGATPVAALTKSDLCPNVEEKIAEVQNAAPGVDVLAVSSLDGDCEAVMKYILPGRTVAFIGSSGVGKSTLINKLTGTDSIATREIGSDGRVVTQLPIGNSSPFQTAHLSLTRPACASLVCGTAATVLIRRLRTSKSCPARADIPTALTPLSPDAPFCVRFRTESLPPRALNLIGN